MNKIFFSITFSFILIHSNINAMQDNRPAQWKKIGTIVASQAITTAIAYPSILQFCPLSDRCIEAAVALSIGMLGSACCISYLYPETEAEKKKHADQLDINKIN